MSGKNLLTVDLFGENDMSVIECPEVYEPYDTSPLFLGGGITGCPDWQSDFIWYMSDVPDLVLINPRRASFDVNDPAATPFQIKWEYEHIKMSAAVLFWFPCETLCPITLYELGVAAALNRNIFVGCHPKYARAQDVKEQLALIRPDVHVYDSLAALEIKVRHWFANLQSILDK